MKRLRILRISEKGNARYSTFIHRDEMFPALNVGEDGYVGESDIKFARMVSMDEVFTVVGLKREKKNNKNICYESMCCRLCRSN